jgi:hypothetical protein
MSGKRKMLLRSVWVDIDSLVNHGDEEPGISIFYCDVSLRFRSVREKETITVYVGGRYNSEETKGRCFRLFYDCERQLKSTVCQRRIILPQDLTSRVCGEIEKEIVGLTG